jgi:hypothetical protein
MNYKYIKIKLEGGGSYIQPKSKIQDAIDGELDGLCFGQEIVLHFTPVTMSDLEYENLPDFSGH